jgi:hypothetical protein
MKALISAFIYSYISLFITQQIIGAFSFGFNPSFTIILVVTCFALFMYLKLIIVKFLGLPKKGPGFLVLTFLMVSMLMYLLSIFSPGFSINDGYIEQLVVFGVVLPSKQLSATWALVFSSLLFSISYNFFNWLRN